MWASQYGRAEVVKLLLSAGADIHARDPVST
jgi:ankyrin repeat protein